MKLRSTFFRPVALVAQVALLAHLSALAEANDELKEPLGTGQGRQIIEEKLVRIRLEQFRADGWPLGEVVRFLTDEARRRDPEKKGINFVLTSNGNTDAPPGEPLEVPDINSIAIKIMPPLSDVRLVDALNAVVNVADSPLKHSTQHHA